MQYHDSARPRGPNGKPLYLTPGGWLAALPQLSIEPTNEGTHRISVMLLITHNGGQWFHHTTGDLAPFLDAWGADPEATMEAVFGWKWIGKAREEKLTVSLEDLGL